MLTTFMPSKPSELAKSNSTKHIPCTPAGRRRGHIELCSPIPVVSPLEGAFNLETLRICVFLGVTVSAAQCRKVQIRHFLTELQDKVNSLFRVIVECLAAIFARSLMHGTSVVHRETFLILEMCFSRNYS